MDSRESETNSLSKVMQMLQTLIIQLQKSHGETVVELSSICSQLYAKPHLSHIS